VQWPLFSNVRAIVFLKENARNFVKNTNDNSLITLTVNHLEIQFRLERKRAQYDYRQRPRTLLRKVPLLSRRANRHRARVPHYENARNHERNTVRGEGEGEGGGTEMPLGPALGELEACRGDEGYLRRI